MKKRFITLIVMTLSLVFAVSANLSASVFNDVKSDAWYAHTVEYCNEKGYMTGLSEVNFGPEVPMSRAMLVTVLYRAAGKPEVTAVNSFPDVEAGLWYSDAVVWGVENGIVAGYENNTFQPGKNVSRQELTVFIYRYLSSRGEVPAGDVDMMIYQSFLDASEVGSWAKTAASWCASVGLVGGMEGYLKPQASSTRAQIATVLHRIDGYLDGDTDTLTATAGSHGRISPAGTFTLVNGAAVNFSFIADSGYLVDDVKVDGVSLGYMISKGITLNGVSHTVSVSFKKMAGNPNSGYAQLVNRTYPLANAASYVPNNLLNVNYANGTQKMQGDAAAALNSMMAAFKKAYPNLPVIAQSGYRSYGTQQTLYQNQIAKQGNNIYKAGTISAIPGTSEHQLGLAMDISTNGSLVQSFGTTTQGKWFLSHCNEYGFILRYPADKQTVTGIIYEPWHFRYVGTDVAAEMKKIGVTTLEEYYGLYLNSADLTPYLPYLK